mgnify:FL=1
MTRTVTIDVFIIIQNNADYVFNFKTFSYAKKAEVQDEYAPEIRDIAGNSCFYVPTGAEGYTSSSVYFTSESEVYGYEMVDIGGGHQMLFGVNEDWQPWLGLRSETDLPASMITYGTSRSQFNAAWSQEEEGEKLKIHVPQGSETDYIKAWRYAWCGYTDAGEETAYMRMWDGIQWDNIDWDTWEFPSDEQTMQLLD